MRWRDTRSGDLLLTLTPDGGPDFLIFVIEVGVSLNMYVKLVMFSERRATFTRLSVGDGRNDHTNITLLARRECEVPTY